ncbi:MAG: hypothetical protein K8L99_07865 [Anaerolineae bacterium]|nr:hypothetical protein [Anaerolineae bacterium]
MNDSNLSRLEIIANELIVIFEITSPPIPIESMLQHPRSEMWEEVDILQLTYGFLMKEKYSPRMSLARLLARHIVESPWGQARKLKDLVPDEEVVRKFARMLIMPLPMIKALSKSAHNPPEMSTHFEVPLKDAELRLQEASSYL